MKKGLKMVTFLLSMAFVVSPLSACGESNVTNNNTSNSADRYNNTSDTMETSNSSDNTDSNDNGNEGTVTLTAWVPDNIRIEDWNTNAMTLYLEEQTGYDLEMVPLSSEDYTTKVNMSLTAGSPDELPDIIFSSGFTDTAVWSWAEAGSIIPLTDYYNDPELTVNINEAKERTGVDYTQQIVSPDGNIYGVAVYNQSYGNEYFSKLWIYQPWLEALGQEVPTTTEEFYELLKLVAETDLNENGKKDEIGMLGSVGMYSAYWKALMSAFTYAGDSQYRVVEDGSVSVAYTTDEWKEGLKYLKQMFDDGLIAPESLTMSDEQFKTLINSDDPTVFSFVYAAASMVESGTDRQTDYICIDTLTGPEGINYSIYAPSVANITMVVTSNCSNPEAAFRIGDLLSSEYIGISQRWGEEGVNWDYAENVENISDYVPSVEGFDLSIVAYDDAAFWAGTEVSNGSWRQTGPYVRQYGIANGVGTLAGRADKYTEILNDANSLYQTAGHQPAEVIPKLIYTTDESDAIAEIESVLNTYVNESMASFVAGSRDIDADWDNYLAEIDNIGLSQYLEVVQTAYDRMYK